MSIHEAVATVFTEVAQEQGRPSLPPLHEDTPLVRLGLDSLCMAVIVARLEGALGRDPFTEAEEIAIPETFGDFVALYETVLA